MRKYSYIMIATLVVSAPSFAHAGIGDYLSRAANWWQARSVQASETVPETQPTENPSDETPDAPPAPPGSTQPPGRAPGMCAVPREPQRTECQTGSGFLCVSTPPGGVAADSLRIQGTIDRQGSVLASMRISVQNEYTNRMVIVDTTQAAVGDCWGASPPSGPFCLARDGKFSALIPLSSQGPHTISVSASRLSGRSEEVRVRTSRVVPVQVSADKLSFNPDVRTRQGTDAQTVTVTANLLGDCRFCDFIGASTGGVRFEVENSIRDSNGSVRSISCATTMEQGGQGRFTVGIPVQAGTNSLTIRACNAQTEPGPCPSTSPTVGGITFQGQGTASALNITSPPPAPSYDSTEYPRINWEFSLGGAASCMSLKFNREAPREICPNASGRYSTELNPKRGINVATLAREGGADELAWTFGWGRIASPFTNDGGRIEISNAAQAALPVATVRDIILPIANNFLKSDELKTYIERAFSGEGGTAGEDASAETQIAIPMCEEGAGSSYGISLRGQPSFSDALLKDLVFESGKLNLSARFDDLNVGVNLVMTPGTAPLPLVIAFRRALADLSLETRRGADGRTLVLLTSPHDDCSFKSPTYCRHMPAPLIPSRFIGGANERGHIVRCDESLAPEADKARCAAFNSVNEQTGYMNEAVLDAINSAIYCGGSRALTKFARGTSAMNIALGCESQPCSGAIERILPRVSAPVRLNFENGIEISEGGFLATADASIGSRQIYERTPERSKVATAGTIVTDAASDRPISSPSSGGGDISAALSLDAVNALLFALVAQGDGRASRGLFDFDIDESFFNLVEIEGRPFDFVRDCDAFVPPTNGTGGTPANGVSAAQTLCGETSSPATTPPMLCQIRPRVGELLGTTLTEYGYFSAKQPVMLSIRGNRALGPMISVTTLNDLPVVERVGQTTEGGAQSSSAAQTPAPPVDTPTGSLVELELGGLSLAFYALEVDRAVAPDQYGNLAIRRGTNGEPIIHSMRPDDNDPWNGPIVSFDLSLLLGIEIGDIAPDPRDAGKFVMTIRPLADRSRLIITPMAGGNSTTVPPMGIISSLAERLNYVLSEKSKRENSICTEVPREIALDSLGSRDGLFATMGLKTLSFGQEGPSLDFDPVLNSVKVAVDAVISQLVHVGGEEVRASVP